MPDQQQDKTVDLGRFPRTAEAGGPTGTDLAAAILCLIWIVSVAAYMIFSPGEQGPLGLVMTALVVFLPLALIWVVRHHVTFDPRACGTRRCGCRRQWMRCAAPMSPRVRRRRLWGSGRRSRRSWTRLRRGSGRPRRCWPTSPRGAIRRRALPSADRKAVLALPRPSARDEQPALALGTPAEELRAAADGG